MNPTRTKWQGSCGAASAVLCLFVALDGGCSSMDCAPYGCANEAHLNGSVVISRDVTVVDSRLCFGSTCTEDSIDLAAVNAGMPCALWGAGPKVCLAKTSDSEMFDLRAISSEFAENRAPPDVTVQLTLVDHASGRVLLEETRTAKSRTTSTDDCHGCWTAEATL
jgi:hypothetical protein